MKLILHPSLCFMKPSSILIYLGVLCICLSLIGYFTDHAQASLTTPIEIPTAINTEFPELENPKFEMYSVEYNDHDYIVLNRKGITHDESCACRRDRK